MRFCAHVFSRDENAYVFSRAFFHVAKTRAFSRAFYDKTHEGNGCVFARVFPRALFSRAIFALVLFTRVFITISGDAGPGPGPGPGYPLFFILSSYAVLSFLFTLPSLFYLFPSFLISARFHNRRASRVYFPEYAVPIIFIFDFLFPGIPDLEKR